MDTLMWLRAISGSLFFIEFVAYSITAFIFYQPKYRVFSVILFDNIIISGLNALLSVYLSDGGDLQWAWLVYAFSCVRLIITFYYVLTYVDTCHDEFYDIERDPPDVVQNMCIATFITIVAGLVINLVDSQALRWAIFVLDFVPFVLAIMFLFRAVYIANGPQKAPLWVRIAVYINLAFWFGYPIVMLLGPLFITTISTDDEALGYVLLDFVTKHLSMAIFAGYIGRNVHKNVQIYHASDSKMTMELRSLSMPSHT